MGKGTKFLNYITWIDHYLDEYYLMNYEFLTRITSSLTSNSYCVVYYDAAQGNPVVVTIKRLGGETVRKLVDEYLVTILIDNYDYPIARFKLSSTELMNNELVMRVIRDNDHLSYQF